MSWGVHTVLMRARTLIGMCLWYTLPANICACLWGQDTWSAAAGALSGSHTFCDVGTSDTTGHYRHTWHSICHLIWHLEYCNGRGRRQQQASGGPWVPQGTPNLFGLSNPAPVFLLVMLEAQCVAPVADLYPWDVSAAVYSKEKEIPLARVTT